MIISKMPILQGQLYINNQQIDKRNKLSYLGTTTNEE